MPKFGVPGLLSNFNYMFQKRNVALQNNKEVLKILGSIPDTFLPFTLHTLTFQTRPENKKVMQYITTNFNFKWTLAYL
jgi:hypothetical protein